MKTKLNIVLLALILLSGREILAQSHIELTGGATAACPDQSDPLIQSLTVPQYTDSLILNYRMGGGFYPTSIFEIVEIDYQPTCVERTRPPATADTLTVKVLDASNNVLFSDSHAPAVSTGTINYCGEDTVVIATESERLYVSERIDVSSLTASGEAIVKLAVGGCTSNALAAGQPVSQTRALLYASGLGHCSASVPTVTTKKTSKTSANVIIDFAFPVGAVQRKVVLKRMAWRDGKGGQHAEAIVEEWEDGDPGFTPAGPFIVDVNELPATLQARFVAEVSYVDIENGCEADGRGFGAVECDTCNTAVGDPVSLVDGNMRFVDVDPLPPILEHALTRTFDSGHGVDGFFGIGWTTMFDQAITINQTITDEIIHLTTPENETVAFRGTGQQIWPPDVKVPSSLRFDDASGAYAYRPAGGRYETLFDPQDGFFVGMRDVHTGQELQVTRQTDLGGVITALLVVDSWTGMTWTMMVANNLVQSIATTGGVTWTYDYNTNAHLLGVNGPGGDWRTYTYGTGGLTAIRDAAGNTIEAHQYDAQGRAITSVGPSDEIANIEYDLPAPGNGSKTRITTGGGAIIETILHPVGGAHRVKERNGGCASCGSRDEVVVHDAQGRMVRSQDASGYITKNVYTDGRLEETIRFMRPSDCDPAVAVDQCRLTSAALESVSLANTEASVSTIYAFEDPAWPDKPTLITTASVRKTDDSTIETRTYDEATGQTLVESITGWTGYPVAVSETHTTTIDLYGESENAAFDPGGSFTWASFGQPRRTESVDGPRTDVADITTYVYYPVATEVPAAARGKLAAVRNAAGHITRFENYDLFGTARKVTDPNGVVTEFTTDAIGRVLTTTLKGVSGCNTTLDPICDEDLVASRTYDDLGPLLHETQAGGGVVAYTYDSRGRVAMVSRGPALNDLRERLETTYDPDTGKKDRERYLAYTGGNWVERKRESYGYDDEGRLITTTHADNTTVEYAYDVAGRTASIRDENHTTPNTKHGYDPAGRLRAVTQTLDGAPGDEVTTTYSYDRHGNLTEVVDPNGNETEYVFDDFGRVLQQDSPVTGVTAYEYDKAANLLSVTDANEAVTTRVYDALGRVTSAQARRDNDTETVSWTYDSGTNAIGRLSTMSDPTGSTGYSYDRRGLLLREARTLDGASYVTGYQYDADGNRSAIVNPGGRVIDYTFDYAGRAMSATTGGTSIVTSARYRPFGPLEEMVLGNGTTRTMTFDNRYRPLTNVLTGPSGTIASYAYGYDAAGNITELHDVLDPTYNRDFGYDDLNRLVTANGGASLWGTGTFAYDAMGNMTSSTLGAAVQTFSYDGVTPLLTSVNDGATRAVAYDSAGNELMVGSLANTYSPRNLLQRSGLATYKFDGRGVRTVAIAAPLIAAVTFNVSATQSGVDIGGEIELGAPAPVGGATVMLSSNDPAAQVPASVTIPGGQLVGQFSIDVASVTTTTMVTITAVLGASSDGASFAIEPAILANLSFDVEALAPNGSAIGTVTLNGEAPAGGVEIDLSSDHPTLLDLPLSVTVTENATSATFTATSNGPVPAVTGVVVTAAYSSSDEIADLQLLPPQVVSIVLTPAAVEGGQQVTADVTLSGPAAAGTTVTFESTNATAAAPDPVAIDAGSTTGQAVVQTGIVATQETAVLTAELEPTSATASLTINPLAVTLDAISVDPTSVIGSNNATLTVTLTAPAPQGGIDVELVGGSGTAVEHVPFVTVPAGQLAASVEVTTPLCLESCTAATLHARHGVTTRETNLQIDAPSGPTRIVKSLTVDTPRIVGGDDATGTIRLHPAQGLGATARLSSSDPAVTVPARVLIGGNISTRTFKIDTSAVIEPMEVTITATDNDFLAVSRMLLTVVPTSQSVTLDSVALPSTGIGGNSITGTVTLSGPAPSGGAVVALSGSRTGLATVPASVTVPEGAFRTNFSVSTLATDYPRGVLVVGTYNSIVRSDSVIVNPSSASQPVAVAGDVRALPAISPSPHAYLGMLSSSTTSDPRPASALSASNLRRLYVYTPELNLLSETEMTSDVTPTIQYEYVWFAGQPVAQIESATNDISWYSNDHLGAPLLQTDLASVALWRVERTPYGDVFAVRQGEQRHQPLGLPGQEESGELTYNVHRWYRADWGRYTQADPIGLAGRGKNIYRYASSNPISFMDPDGLKDYPPAFIGPLLQEDTRGSEVPFVADINDPRIEHILNGGTAPGFYYPPGTEPELQMECVSLTKAFTGAPCTGCWRRGPVVYRNANVPVGTAIAAGWDSSGRYPKGDVDKNSGLFAGQSGSTVYIIDQYPEDSNGKPHKAAVRPLPLTGGWPSNNGGAYHVITKARRCQCY